MAKQASQGEGIKSKLKSMLGLKKGASIISVGHEEREVEELLLTSDILKDIGKESTHIHRCKVLRELTEKVANRKLEEHAIEALWQAIQDLLLPSTNTEARQTALRFLAALAAGQYHKLGMLRAQFFRLIVSHNVKEDLGYRVDLLQVLTGNGKDISYCEQIGTFLVAFLPDAIKGDRAEDVLRFLINIVHYNSSFLDTETITSLVNLSCKYCGQARDEKEVKILLELLDAVVSYSGLPSSALHSLISTLCKTVNIETLCHISWKLMKKLAGTRLGHSAIYIMCCILEDDANLSDINLLRGAIFFIGMCVWGSKRVLSLRHKPISLLPSIKRGLRCNHPIVAHETGLSLQRLVKKYGQELEVVSWDLILDITENLLKLLEGFSTDQESLRGNVHGLITSIEELYCAGRFGGSAERFFAITEKCARDRPASSIIGLLEFIGENLHPMKEQWLEKLQDAMEKYYKREKRSIVRVKVLDMLSSIAASHKYWYEDEIIEKVTVPYLGSVYDEKDNSVRLVAAQLLVDLVVSCSTTKCIEILTLIEKLINRYTDEEPEIVSLGTQDEDTDVEFFQDVEVAVKGLIEAFKVKIFDQPITNAVRIYEILISHVIGHYVYGIAGETASNTRKQIFLFLLGLRADQLHRIGVQDLENPEKDVRHSVYVSCKASDVYEDGYKEVTSSAVIEQYKVSFVLECPYYKAFDAILNGLKDEWDWRVFEVLLKYLPQQLRSKTLVIGGKGDVNTLCALLCKMVNDRLYLNKMKHIPQGIGRPEFLSMVFSTLAVLATYCDWLEKSKQYDLIMSMELGLNSQCGRTCVTCLTICTLEMRSAMMRVLPSILVRLSQISATIPMSMPVLEFLSCLKEIPTLYSNFVEEQYMSIFAIALPYTDAYKYSKYTVTLAHHVITSWFTRCRLSFRRGFVKLITKGLKSSAILPSQAETKAKSDTSQAKMQENLDQTREFHEEMTQVCLDMMARYTFSTCSSQPKRSPLVEFLLSNGVSQTWLLGNMLVTITTNGKANENCPICSDFGRKREAAKRAAAKVRKLLAMSDAGRKESEKNTLSRSRTVSEIRSPVGSGGIQRSRTVAECSSNKAPTPSITENASKAQALSASYNDKPACDRQGLQVESIATSESNRKSGDFDTKSEALTAKNTPSQSLIKSPESPEKTKNPDVSPIHKGTDSSHVPLIEKPLVTSDGSYGSIFSPSRELLFSRQSSQTEAMLSVVDTDVSPSLAQSKPKDIIFHTDVISEVRSDLENPETSVGKASLVESKTGQSEEPDTPQQKDKILIKRSSQNMDGVTVEVSDTKDASDAALQIEVEPSLRSERLDSGISTKTDRLVAEYEIIDFTPSGDEQEAFSNTEPLRPSLSETICNCSCEGWAEIVIRRPCGNVSWITKIENRRIPEWNSNVLADIAGLAASFEYEERASQGDRSVDAISVEKGSRLPLSGIDDVARNFQSTRSSSSGTKQSEKDISMPVPVRRRRFSTGSVDIPGAFKFNMPSPDTTMISSKDEELGASWQGKTYFEKPSVGQSPMTPFQSTNNWSFHDSRTVVDEATNGKEKDKDTSRGIDIQISGRISQNRDQNVLGLSPKSALRRCYSGSASIPSTVPHLPEPILVEDSNAPAANSTLTVDVRTPPNSHVGEDKEKSDNLITGPEAGYAASGLKTLTIDDSKRQSSGKASPRPRGKTVSGLPLWKPQGQQGRNVYNAPEEEVWQGVSNPHFLFLQLFYSPVLGCNAMYRPLLLEAGEVIDRAVKILDRIPSFDTHKVGVLYVGRGQESDEKAILGNVYGSSRYAEFVSGLGDLIKLAECSTTETYTGGLDRNGNDGQCAYSWKDASTQVIFHVATMMPKKQSDPSCHSKKLHIGNNFVTIVYNDSQSEYHFGTIKGQFNFGEIVITPLDYSSNLVTVRVKEELQDLILNTGPHVISDGNLPLLVRQLAVYTNMVTVIHQKDKKPGLAYGCNWLERLKQIKRMRSKVTSDVRQQTSSAAFRGNVMTVKPDDTFSTDFTDYT